MNAIQFQKILLVGLLSIFLVACLSNPIRRAVPTKPTLEITILEDGGMCLDKDGAEKLGVYILELERISP